MLKLERKIVIVTRPTRLQGLVAQYATPQQAKFRMVRSKVMAAAASAPMLAARSGKVDAVALSKLDDAAEQRASVDFDQLRDEDSDYNAIVADLRNQLAALAPVHVLDRQYLPNFVFGPQDVVVTIGQDGLVANTAKYALGRSIVAVNPDPKKIDGILLPFTAAEALPAVQKCLRGSADTQQVTLAEAELIDGQRLLAFNDFFIGAKTHVSARYTIELAGRREAQSSSGVIVSTGAGSTGWLSSVLNMQAATGRLAEEGRGEGRTDVSAAANAGVSVPPNLAHPAGLRLSREDARLVFVTREPFLSKTSGIALTSGILSPGQDLVVESNMSREGVIFSDGIEADFLEFNSGAIARIRASKERAVLVVKR